MASAHTMDDETVEDVTTTEDAAPAGADAPIPASADADDPGTPSDDDAGGDAGQTDTTEGDRAGDAPAAVVEVEAPKPTPFLAKVLGQQYEAKALGMDGAQVRPDGTVEIPPGQAAQRLSALIAKGRMYEERVPQQLHEAREAARQAQASFNEDAERGRAMYEFFSGLAGKSEQEIYDFVMDFKQQKPLLDAKVERALAQAQLAASQRQQMTPTYNLPMEVIEAQAQEAAWQASLGVRAKVKGLTDAEAFEVADKLWKRKELYLGTADRDYPEHGIVRGQPVFRTADWEADFVDRAQDVVRGRQALAKAAKAVPKVAQAASGNAAVLAQASGKGKAGAPPPPPGTAASTAAGQPGSFATEAEYKAYMKKTYGV